MFYLFIKGDYLMRHFNGINEGDLLTLLQIARAAIASIDAPHIVQWQNALDSEELDRLHNIAARYIRAHEVTQ
jgi:hypothetical protein